MKKFEHRVEKYKSNDTRRMLDLSLNFRSLKFNGYIICKFIVINSMKTNFWNSVKLVSVPIRAVCVKRLID